MERLHMKRTKTRGRLAGLVSAAILVAGIGLVGPATGAAAAVTKQSRPAARPLAAAAATSATGTWIESIDWSCDGNPGSSVISFNADHTWTSTPFVHNGRWFQVNSMVVWTFADVPNLVYTANVSGSQMSGIQGYETVNGFNGCFTATLAFTAKAAAAAAVVKGSDATIGR
jgi:hypothetical protein